MCVRETGSTCPTQNLNDKVHPEGRKAQGKSPAGVEGPVREQNQPTYESAGPGNGKNLVHSSSLSHSSLLLPQITVFLGKSLTHVCLKTRKGPC